MDRAAHPKAALGLPDRFLSTLRPLHGSTGVIKSLILPGKKTGVVRVHATSAFPPDSIYSGC